MEIHTILSFSQLIHQCNCLRVLDRAVEKKKNEKRLNSRVVGSRDLKLIYVRCDIHWKDGSDRHGSESWFHQQPAVRL